jgi:hypothetical protein
MSNGQFQLLGSQRKRPIVALETAIGWLIAPMPATCRTSYLPGSEQGFGLWWCDDRPVVCVGGPP